MTLATTLKKNQSLQRLNLASNQSNIKGAQVIATALEVNQTLDAFILFQEQITQFATLCIQKQTDPSVPKRLL